MFRSCSRAPAMAEVGSCELRYMSYPVVVMSGTVQDYEIRVEFEQV